MPKEVTLEMEIKPPPAWVVWLSRLIYLFNKDTAIELMTKHIKYRVGDGTWKSFVK